MNEVIQKIMEGGAEEAEKVSSMFEGAKGGRTRSTTNDLYELLERAAVLKQALLQLEEGIDDYNKLFNSDADAKTGIAQEPADFYNLLSNNGFNIASVQELNALVEQLSSLIAEKPGSKGMKLGKLMDLVTAFEDTPEEQFKSEMGKYKVYIKEEESKHRRGKEEQLFQERKKSTRPIQIFLWCFDASKAVQARATRNT